MHPDEFGRRIGLEHHAEIALVRRNPPHRAALDAKLSAIRLEEAGNHVQGCRLPAARRAEEGRRDPGLCVPAPFGIEEWKYT